jgi:hypothetical protein
MPAGLIRKAQPTLSQVHVAAPLTNIAVAYMQDDDNYIADKVFPIVPVEFQSDLYYKWSKDDFFRDEAQQRADGQESAGSGLNLTTDSYAAAVWALHKDIGDQMRRNADPAVDIEVAVTRALMQKLLIRRDRIFASKYLATGIWGTDITGSATPTGAQVYQWSDGANSDPFTDVAAGQTVILRIPARRATSWCWASRFIRRCASTRWSSTASNTRCRPTPGLSRPSSWPRRSTSIGSWLPSRPTTPRTKARPRRRPIRLRSARWRCFATLLRRRVSWFRRRVTSSDGPASRAMATGYLGMERAGAQPRPPWFDRPLRNGDGLRHEGGRFGPRLLLHLDRRLTDFEGGALWHCPRVRFKGVSNGHAYPFPNSADPAEAGGAYVRRAFDFGKRKLKNGDQLTRKELASIPPANLTALVNTKVLQLFPAGPAEIFVAERYVVPAEDGKFLVIEGRRVTQNPVSKRHAQKLAKG